MQEETGEACNHILLNLPYTSAMRMTPSVGEDGGQNCHQYRGYAVYDHVITKKLIVGVAETVWLWRLMTDLMNRLHGARDLCPPAFLEISYARRLHPKTYPGPYVGNTIRLNHSGLRRTHANIGTRPRDNV